MGQPSLMTYHNHTDATDRKTMSIIRFEDAANRMLNSAVMPVLNSPLAPLVWPFIATITYTGRRSGKQQGPCLDAIGDTTPSGSTTTPPRHAGPTSWRRCAKALT